MAGGLGGAILCLVFIGLDETAASMTYASLELPYATAGAPYFWLAHTLVLTPALMLLWWSVSPNLSRPVAAISSRIDESAARTWALATGLWAALSIVIFRIARALVANDLALTSTELEGRFAGQLLAEGRLSMDAPPLYAHMPESFDVVAGDQQIAAGSSMLDQGAMALAELGGGAWVHAAIAGLGVWAMIMVVSELTNRRWGLLAGVLAVTSPLLFFPSITQHPALVSRTLVLFAIAMALRHRRTQATKDAALFGLFFGLAVSTRGLEAGAVLLPWWVLLARVGPKSLAAGLAGLVGPIVLFAAHALATTGSPWLSPGWQTKPFVVSSSSWWGRFGEQSADGALLLSVWFGGGLGLLFVVWGMVRGGKDAHYLSASLAGLLLARLFAPGVEGHHIGPIGLLEAGAVLTPLAVLGVKSCVESADDHTRRHQLSAAVIMLLVASTAAFSAYHGRALARFQSTQMLVYGITSTIARPSVVLVPEYSRAWQALDSKVPYGSLNRWRHFSPTISDDEVVFVIAGRVPESEIAAAYPDRDIVALVPAGEGELGLALVREAGR